MPQRVAEQIAAVVLSGLFAVMTGCGGAQTPADEAPPTFGAGLTMRYDYRSTHGTSVFEIEVIDDRRLIYRGVAGEVTGLEGGVDYTRRDITPGVVFLSWAEEDGRVTAQVIDLLHLEVHSIEVSSEGERVELDGKIEIVRAAR
ncbi:MAG: hypothetical protein DRJ42_27220 [Deltaproteobacteria bacterium]|nr:MAG: hypothetical protein DRJ42_27220 [Deltaproteobacteria bacterium]